MKGLVVDLFAGGGGTSLGIEWAFGRSPDIAINHDREAIAMHAANHPETKHYTEDSYLIDIVCERLVRGKLVRGRLPGEAQVRMVGNSVPPQLAMAMARANAPAELEQVA